MRQKKPRKGSSLDDYVRQKKAKDPVFAEGFDEGLQELQVGMILKMARKEAKNDTTRSCRSIGHSDVGHLAS